MEHELSATALWPVSVEVVIALDQKFGTPVDCYVNGTQTWLTPDGPNEFMLEWRLHPVGEYETPLGMSHYEVFETVIAAISVGADVAHLSLGDEHRSLDGLWSGLECFGAYGDPMSSDELARCSERALGIAPAQHGVVDHHSISEEWLRTGKQQSLYRLVSDALTSAGNQPK